MSRQSFSGAANAQNIEERVELSAQTVGFITSQGIVWQGMVRADSEKDTWHVIEGTQKPNTIFKQVGELEPMLSTRRKTTEALSFEDALERLAVWEKASISRDEKVAPSFEAEDLGHHHYSYLAMSRDYLVDTRGHAHHTPGRIPSAGGRFEQKDIDALNNYRDGIARGDILEAIFTSSTPLYIQSNNAIEAALENRENIGQFAQLGFLSQILIEGAKANISVINDLISGRFRPKTKEEIQQRCLERLRYSPFFSESNVKRLNELREALRDQIFYFFHMSGDDWRDAKLDVTDHDFLVKIKSYPQTYELYNALWNEIEHPLDEDSASAALYLAARGSALLKEELLQSPLQFVLGQEGLYNHTDVTELLNFMQLLNLKLSFFVNTLPGTRQRARDFLIQDVNALTRRMSMDSGLSALHIKGVTEFILSNADVHMPRRLQDMPERLDQARERVEEEVRGRGLEKQGRFDLTVNIDTKNPGDIKPTR